ncbi:uncharacterized protein KZ484_006775 isoform 1-T2 [Pholidichthys leucotaenia]
MSNDSDKDRVLKITKVRTTLKNDDSWIHKPQDEKKEQNKAGIKDRKDQPVPMTLYVQSTAKKYDDLVNLKKSEATSFLKAAELEGSTVKTRRDTEPHVPTEPAKQIILKSASQKEPNVEGLNDLAAFHPDAHVEVEPMVSADANVEKPTAETSVVVPTAGVEEPADSAKLENPGADNTVQPTIVTQGDEAADRSCETFDPEKGAEEKSGDSATESDPESRGDHMSELKIKDAVDAATTSCAEGVEDYVVQRAIKLADVLEVEALEAESASKPVEEPEEPPSEESKLEQQCDENTDLVNLKKSEATSFLKAAELEGSTVKTRRDTEPHVPTEPAKQIILKSASQKEPNVEGLNDLAAFHPDAHVEVEPMVSADANVEKPTAETSVVVPTAGVEEPADSAKLENPGADNTVQPTIVTQGDEAADRSCETFDPEKGAEEKSGDSATESDPESRGDHMSELKIKDAVDAATTSCAEGVEDYVVQRAIKLADVLEVEALEAESASKPVEEPEEPPSEESKLEQQCDENTSEAIQQPVNELISPQALKPRDVCSFCKQEIDGNVKLKLTDPLLTWHSECLKCGICAVALDLMTPMFLHKKVILCGDCFEKAWL